MEPNRYITKSDGSLKPGTRDHPNPVELNELLKNNFKVTTILTSIAPSYKFTDWLEYKLLVSVNYSTGITRFSANQDLQSDPGGTATISNSELITEQVTNTLNFNKKIFDDLNLDAVCGFEYMEFTMKGSSLTGEEQVEQDLVIMVWIIQTMFSILQRVHAVYLHL
jgi:iron complex outermembrane receptor protein